MHFVYRCTYLFFLLSLLSLTPVLDNLEGHDMGDLTLPLLLPLTLPLTLPLPLHLPLPLPLPLT
jgi:hypothetical protein